jgi:multiple sugar transport system substrate-binding protein
MTKRFLLLLVVLVTLLAACTTPTATPTQAPNTIDPTASEAATGESATISFAVFGDPAEQAAYETLVATFEARYPNIDIELRHTPGQNDYRRQLAADYAAGIPPDVSLMNHRRIGNFAANELMEPLGPYLENSMVFQPEDFYPITLEAFEWRGTVMCIPQNISSLVVYYNKDMFDAAGLDYPSFDWTWDDFITIAKALTQDTDGDGAMDQYGLGTDASFFRLVPFVVQNQGAIVDDINFPTRLTMNRQVSMEAMQWFVDWRLVHGIVPTREEEASLDSESRFIEGTTAMFLNSRRGTPTYREISTFDWDVAPLPVGVQRAGLLHTDGYCMSAQTANKDAAWTFIEFANSPEGQAVVAATGRTVPSLIEVAESPAFLDPNAKPANNRVFLDTIPDLTRVPTIATWEEIEGTASEELERAFYGDVSVREAADTMFIRTEEYFRLANLHLTPTPQ